MFTAREAVRMFTTTDGDHVCEDFKMKRLVLEADYTWASVGQQGTPGLVGYVGFKVTGAAWLGGDGVRQVGAAGFAGRLAGLPDQPPHSKHK